MKSFGKDLRKERLEELVTELQKSLKYEKKKIEVIREVVTSNGLENEDPFQGVKGKLLKEVMTKGCRDTYNAAFGRYNTRLYA